ncbi:O-acetyl-ADP-ribose deacetylase [Sporolactobacillus shoreicorticis]|uniref:O-acetyl-ADP-ribose deacetylase n=1 Tax=Sporolactobacillus shoreicorticis TaxID=1923877 RepID=A0ABW5S269_9BACL|nr:O-acetyl-ADP-ribose deacetylase [Sporolactobacillus shoreicorticis]MCO7125875.1 O-acetyl-ADP-ribose deacetylase [Sporolactobacillus shoreicorticis]
MNKITIMLGDITQVSADAIVNAANTSLLGGEGVDGAIHRVAGPQLLDECRTLNGCRTGEAKITSGYRLPAKYVIHTPGPIWQGGTHHERELLKSSYVNSLKLAETHDCRTVAFPSISTGVYHFPLELAAPTAIQAIQDFLRTSKIVSHVQMVCFDERTKHAYDQALSTVNER